MDPSQHLQQLNQWRQELESLRPLSQQQLQQLHAVFKASEIETIYQSNAIEGNSLTLRETELVVAHGITVAGKPLKDHLEAINLAAALQVVNDLITNATPLSNDIVLQLHRIILTRIDDANAGRFRNVPVRIVGAQHVPPAAYKVADLMDRLWQQYELARTTAHPVLVAAQLHQDIVGIHPFVDGNGRTARLAMNVHLLQHGYPHINISPQRDSRLAYYESLDAAHTNQNLHAFHAFVVQHVHNALEHYLQILRRENPPSIEPKRTPPSPAHDQR